jgi:pimeloyl-ACP methyl ester carboxylesterase
MGLRKAGYGGEFEYWKWHSTWRGWVVLPVIMAPALLEREARRLAVYVAAQRLANPSRPIHLMGCSCGTFVVLRALEMLPKDVNVQATALLAGAFDPRRELAKSLEHVAGPVVVTSSLGDWVILGLGTLIFGTADRRHSVSAGMVGLPGSSSGRVIQIKWRPSMLACGHMGTHFISSEFIARFVAPAMGITSRSYQTDVPVAGERD